MWTILGIVIALIVVEVILSVTLKRVYEKWDRASLRDFSRRRPPPPLGVYLYAPKAAHGRTILFSAPMGLFCWYFDWKGWKHEERERQELKARELPLILPLAEQVFAKHGTATGSTSPQELAEQVYDLSEEFSLAARGILEKELALDDLEPQWFKDDQKDAEQLGISVPQMYEEELHLMRELHILNSPHLSVEEFELNQRGTLLPTERQEHLSACPICKGLLDMKPE